MIHTSLPLPPREHRRFSHSTNRIAAPAAINLAMEPTFRIGDLVVAPISRTIGIQGGLESSIEPKLMQVLILLSRNRNAVVSRDELLQRCWNGLAVSNDAIERVIGKLRKLEAELAPGSFQITAIPKVGYRLQVAEPEPVAVEMVETKRRSSRGSMLAIVGLGCLCLSAIGIWNAAKR